MPVPETSAQPDAPRKKKKGKRKRNRYSKLVSRYSGYVGLRMAYCVISMLPLRVGLAVGGIAGRLAYIFARKGRRNAVESLTRVYGNEFTDREIRQQVRDVFRHTIATAIEFCILRRWSSEKLEARYPNVVAAVRQLEKDVRATGSGVVGLTAHFGNWEVLSLFVGRFAPGLLVPVAKRSYFKKYQDFIHRVRTADGMDVIYTDESPRRLIRAVRQGKLLGLLPDQNTRTNSGVFVEFFDKPAYTVTFPVDLARRLGVKMIFNCLVRENGGFRFINSGLFDVPRTDDEDADVLEGTQRWTRLLEDSIRKYPTQWSWIYPRWKTTPDRPRYHHGGSRSLLQSRRLLAGPGAEAAVQSTGAAEG